MAAIGGQVFGGFLQGMGAQDSAVASGQSAWVNAKRSSQEADIARNSAATNANAVSETMEKALGGVRAAYGASGVKMDGTPTAVLEADAAKARQNVLNTQYKGQLEAENYDFESRNYIRQMGDANKAASLAVIGTFTGAGGAAFNSAYGGEKMPSSYSSMSGPYAPSNSNAGLY